MYLLHHCAGMASAALVLPLQICCVDQNVYVQLKCILIKLSAVCTALWLPAGASKDPSGAVSLVLLGHLVSCFAPGFTPVPKLIQAYLQLMAAVAESVQDTQQSTMSGETFSNILGQVSRSHSVNSKQGSTVTNAADAVISLSNLQYVHKRCARCTFQHFLRICFSSKAQNCIQERHAKRPWVYLGMPYRPSS